VSGKHAEEGESIVEKVEDFLHIGEHGPETVAAPPEGTQVVRDEKSGEQQFNPPAGWEPPTPPTADDEEEKLKAAFGDPVKGVYAPYVAGVSE
jgi:hypothetical protein